MKHIATMKYIDVMKRVVTMKLSKIVIFTITLFCIFCSVTVHASTRTYGTGEKLYFKSNPSDWSWFGNDLGTGNHVFAYFYNGGSNAWSNEATVYISGILQVTVPTGTWTNVIFTRQSGTTPDWSRVYDGNQSEDIPLNTLTNYIQNFRQKNTSGEGWHWVSTSSAPTADMTSMDGLTCETINVCQQSIDNGDVYSLAPILNGSKTDYDYEGDHIWLKWVSGHWMPVSNDWSNSDVLLEDVADNYYLLWTSIGKSTKRIVHLKRTDCEISCQITSFEYVLTPVNVNDSTFAIEGIVAFTQTAGDLVISYGDSVQRFASPTSPQVFSLQGLRADGTTKTLRAQFEGVGGWTADSTVTAPLPDAGVEIYDSETDDVHYSETGSTYIHNKSIVLRPSVAVTDSFAWTDPNGKVCKSSRSGGDNTFTVADYMQDTTIIMYYTEFNAPPMAESNMMGNGSYETTTSADEDVSTSAYKKTSGYKYTGVWGGVNSKYDVYDNGYSSENGLFGVTTNPHVFWHRMAHIDPRDGTYMAVFDGDNEEQIAWQASTSDNENLVLQKGTTYMFSFWVANVNNYGEMIDMGKKNNAILQFKIKYKDKDDVIHEAFLGEATDLNNDEYFDNLWHQNSATFTSDYDADDVTISVVDKNTSGMRIGNDFALDDIRFRAISVQSGTIRARERFEVKFEEPKTNPVNLQVEWVTKPACGQDTCTMRVSFRYPNITAHDIKLTLKDLNIAGTYGTLVENLTLAKTPIAGNPDSTDYVGYFTSGAYAGATYNNKVKADAMTHSFKAQLIVRDAKDIDHGGYTNATLDAIAIPALTITKADIASPSCSGTTYNLSVDVKYTAQSGATLRYYIDDVSKATRSIDYNVTERSLANVEIFGLTADGKEHTLKVTTGHILDCIATQAFTAPKANTINSFDVEPDQPDCHVVTYTLRATWEIAKQEGGEYDALMIKVGTADPYEITITAANASGENAYFDIPIAYNVGNEHPTIIAYMKERGVSCKESASYVDPIVPRMTIGAPTFEDIECNESTFDLVVPVTYTYQHGKMWAWIDDKTSEKIEITATGNCKTGGSYTGYLAESASSRTTYIVFDNVTLSGDHKVSVECDGEHSCSSTTGTFSAPTLPKTSVVLPASMPTVANCDVPIFDLTFNLKYTYQDGDLQVWVARDATKIGQQTFTASDSDGDSKYIKLNTSEQTKTITLTGLPSDGRSDYKLYYSFGKEGYCGYPTPIEVALPTFPRSPTITDVTVSGVTDKVADCTVETYDATVTVTYKYTSDEKIIIAYTDKDGVAKTYTPVTLTTSPQEITLDDVLDDIGKGAKSLEVYFQKSPVDFSSCHHSATYTAPSNSSINSGYVVTIDNKSTCGNRKYNLSGTITFSDDATDDLIISFPGVRDTTIAKGDCDKTGTPFTMTGLTAETAGKTLIAKFKDQPDCTAASKPLEAVDVPGFDVANMSFTTPACDEITTTLKFDLSYTYQSGTKLYVWVDSGTKKEIAFEANKNNEITISGIEIPGVSADGVAHTLHVEFVGGRCPADEFTTPAAPFSGKISNIQTPSISDEECGLNTYSVSVTFDVSANSAGHKVIATCKGKSGEKVVASGTNTINISGIVRSTPVEADDVVIELYFYDNDNCDPRHSITFDENPFKPIPTFSLDPIGAKCYPATSFDVTYEHTNANKLYYKVTQGETTKKDWTEVTVDATKKFTISTSDWADGAYTVEAYVKSAVGCESATPHPTVTLTINKQPSLELASIDDACAGKSSVSTTVTLKDGATKYDYDVFKNDEVMSAQHKSGQTASSISLSTSTWEPATYKIQVTAYSSVDCPSDPEEVSFVINPNPVIESLTASQTICEEEDAVSYDFTITGAKTYSYSLVDTDIAGTDITVPDGGSGTISFDPSALSDGYYALQVIAKSELGCTTTRTAALKISNKPTVSLTATTNICYLDPAGLDFKYTVSADAKTYYLYLWQADRSQKYGGCGNFDLPTMNEGTIHYDSFSPYGSPLSGGDYVAVMWVKNSAGCVSDSVVVPFTIYPIAGIEIYTVASMCATKPLSTVFYYIHSAKSFRYKIEGVTEWSGPQTPSTEDLKHFEFGISDLSAGTYTLQLQAYNDNCGYSNIAESPFTIYPLPTLNLDVTAAGVNVCHPVAQVDIPYTSTDAKEYTYVLTGGGYNKTDTKSASTSGKIEVDTDGLPAGDYALSVTVVSEHDCEIAAAQTTTIHINPRPTFTFNEGEVRDCHPSTSINVGYTSTNAKTYSYTLTLEGALSPALTVPDQEASVDGVIALSTTGLAAGTYDLVVTATSKDGCDMLASVSRKVIIQAKPTVSIESVESHCAGNASINVSYKTTDATTYYYEVLGTELKGHADAEGEGSFTIDISNLEPGNYTLRMKATAGQCESATDDEQFVIYPIPIVSFVTPAPIKEGVANVTVTLNLTDATKYDWSFIDKDGSTKLESDNNVSASQTTIKLTTGALEEGMYTLYVTPYSATCDGVENDVHVIVNNKPTVNFSDADLVVCAGTETLNVEFSTSPDATVLHYTIMQGSTTVVAEQHVDLTATSSPLAVDISSLPYGTYTLTGYVSSALVSGDNSSVDFTLMAVPTENDVKQDLAFIGCEETYDATITVNIGNAAGKKIYAKYSDGGEHTKHVETSVGDATATLTLTGLTHTDLSVKHKVKVYVDGYEDCGITAEYDEPKLMTITEGFAVTPLPKSCGDEAFTLSGKVVANCNEGKIVVEYDDTYKTEVDASTGGSDFTIADIPAGGSVTKLKAYFQGKTCGVVESAEFVEPTKPEASIAYTPIVAPACDVTTFDLGFTLSYTYQEAGSLTVWVDDDHKSTFTSAGGDYQLLNTSAQTLSGTITGLSADGRIGQKLYYMFDGTHSCSGSIDLPVFPQTPLITGVSVTNVPPYIEGLEGTYSPTITVTYQKAIGERIVLEYLDKNNQSQLAYSTTSVAGDGTYTFDGLTFDDVTMGCRTVHAYFEDSDCKTGGNHDGTYTAPTNSSITFESLTLVNTSTCESLRYNLTGKVSFVGAVVSDLVVEFDETHQYVIPQSQCVAGMPLAFAINGVSESIPVEGKILSAYFSLIPDNVAYSEPVYKPLTPSLNAEIVRVDTIFTCGSKLYSVSLNISSENQRGACFVYDSIAGGTLRRVAKHDGTYNGTDEFTIAMPQRVEEHYIIVRYPNTECVVRFAPISVNPYTKPQPEITLTPIERVCNTATELVMPFAITQGDIAEASLTLTDSKGKTIVSDAELTVNATKDTLTYTLPEQLSAGKHTLMVEVRDTLDCVATATLPIELALDGQIYSKWNDVLLVDNSQGLYSAYQWYENGQLLSGKTDQVLYLPDGMKGTYTCLLTTAEGQLFTCEYEFEDIPRSADQQFSDNDITVLPNRVKAGGVVAVQQSQSETLRLILMSTTGQRIGEYTQTDSKQLICMPAVQGVYLLRITSDSGMQTAKIVVY